MAVKQLLDVIDKRATVEILFKAKRKDNGEWVEGYYVYDNVKIKLLFALLACFMSGCQRLCG